MIKIFDPSNKYFAHRLYREQCTFIDGTYVKDLGSLGRALENTIIVDNNMHVFAYHLSNGVPICSFFGQHWDQELKHLVSRTHNSTSTSSLIPRFVFIHWSMLTNISLLGKHSSGTTQSTRRLPPIIGLNVQTKRKNIRRISVANRPRSLRGQPHSASSRESRSKLCGRIQTRKR